MNIQVCPSCKSELDFKDSAIGKIKCKNKNCLYFNDFFVIQQSIPILIPFKDKYCILKNTTKDQKKNFGDKRRTSKKYNFLRNKFLKNIRTLLIGENKISKRNYKFLSMALNSKSHMTTPTDFRNRWIFRCCKMIAHGNW